MMDARQATIRTATAAPLARWLASLWQVLVESMRRHRLLTIITLVYWLALEVTALSVGGTSVVETTPFEIEFLALVGLFAGAGLIFSIARIMIVERPAGSLYAAIWRDMREHVFTGDRLANALVPMIVMPLFFSTFNSFKRLIPFLNPYSWDPTLAHWDKVLHGGVAPWALLQPVLGFPTVTSTLNVFYNLWFFIMFFTFTWQVLTVRRPALRTHFLVAFLVFWIVIGTVLAILLSSAGPCYFGRVTGLPDPYAPLMSYLHEAAKHAPIWSLDVQEMLWRDYQSHGLMLGGGISAMPSMHIAVSTLMTLLAWRVSRGLGVVYTVFTVIIMIGSVHLGWHYAIDGYVSVLVSLALWYATGWALRRAGHVADAEPRWQVLESR